MKSCAKTKRQLLEEKGGCNINTLQKVSFPTAEFIKCPVNIGDALKGRKNQKAWKDFKLYVKYLDMKVQSPDTGTFQIEHSPRYYQRAIKQLVIKGWAERKGGKVYLRAYQHVWRRMEIERVKVGHKNKYQHKYKYWKIPVGIFSNERKDYLKEIIHEIRKRITKRKLAQIRFALKAKGADRATFSARSASFLFGYNSPYSGSKLRQKYFSLIPMTIEEAKPRFNKISGRFEEPTKSIAL